jgi:hypothetical protein
VGGLALGYVVEPTAETWQQRNQRRRESSAPAMFAVRGAGAVNMSDEPEEEYDVMGGYDTDKMAYTDEEVWGFETPLQPLPRRPLRW